MLEADPYVGFLFRCYSNLFFANLIGLGFGPLLTGWLSDVFTVAHGVVGLRYALMLAILVLIPTGAFLIASAGSLAQDRED